LKESSRSRQEERYEEAAFLRDMLKKQGRGG
jgi:hypothetical protein